MEEDGSAVLVASAEDIEQQFASGLREGCIAEVVDDRQADPGDGPGGGGEADGEPLLVGGQAEGGSNVRFAHARGLEQDRVLAPLDVIAADEFQHQHLVEARNPLDVEAFELFDDGEPRLPDVPLDQAAFAIDQVGNFALPRSECPIATRGTLFRRR